MARKLLTTLANSRAASHLLGLIERLDFGSDQSLRVLTYHRVADPALSPLLYPRVTVHPEVFDLHMRYLSQHCRVVSMQEVLHAVRAVRPPIYNQTTKLSPALHMAPMPQNQPEATLTGRSSERPGSEFAPETTPHLTRLPERAVLITFDDAYNDFAENAWPTLKRYHLPATLFVPTAFPGSPHRAFWWDQLYAAVEYAHNLGIVQTPLGNLPVGSADERRSTFSLLRDYVKFLPHAAAMDWVDHFCAELEVPHLPGMVLTWDALRELNAAGVTLGAHTRTHPLMDRISTDEIRAEAVGSWQDLRREIGEVMPIFAYPSGNYNRLALDVLREEGFELAFTTQRGINPLSKSDPLQFKRINVGPKTSLPILRAQMVEWIGRGLGKILHSV